MVAHYAARQVLKKWKINFKKNYSFTRKIKDIHYKDVHPCKNYIWGKVSEVMYVYSSKTSDM